MILREITELGFFRPFDGAGVRREIAHQAAQQRGFADTVGADDGDALARVDAEIQIGEQHAVEALAHLFHFHRDTVQFFALVVFEADERILAAGRLDVLDLDLVDLARARGGLLGFGGIGREAATKVFSSATFSLVLALSADCCSRAWVEAIM